jgi:holliday junction DNA helicase RuvB
MNDLRPNTLSEYIGQKRLKQMLEIVLIAAKKRGEPPDHILFYGAAGLGKTSMCHVIANELGTHLHVTSAPALASAKDIVGLLHQLETGDVLFIDEIHRLPKVAEELLYPVMEDFQLDLVMGKGNTARTLTLPIPKFTLIGATTRAGMIANPLRDRFGLTCKLEFYERDELAAIVERSAQLLGLTIDQGGIEVIASRSRGTPRIANKLVRRVRDFAQIREVDVDAELAAAALSTCHVDAEGLDPTDRQYLTVIADNYGGGPVGIDTLAATLGEDAETIEDVYEPFLIQKGFIQRTQRGRCTTELAIKYLRGGVA